ncbi:UNKNOWN [Stylonychia lemnae]|uniref:Uncharacterized protein n=1 Tax=Stylonychia lemnae TaxID=5949 RepID=A0A078ADM3_STYLE|nr:UNKNOWN [Stylonychia lemnae]|eukprot:CDW78983.1 UNKNOWN [Stylonychia lemnae]
MLSSNPAIRPTAEQCLKLNQMSQNDFLFNNLAEKQTEDIKINYNKIVWENRGSKLQIYKNMGSLNQTSPHLNISQTADQRPQTNGIKFIQEKFQNIQVTPEPSLSRFQQESQEKSIQDQINCSKFQSVHALASNLCSSNDENEGNFSVDYLDEDQKMTNNLNRLAIVDVQDESKQLYTKNQTRCYRIFE